ncbi:Mitochondrial chaperone Frataxin [Varicellaria rhodocarpa]|nr:Mitochondrial chaperone Frataxin [Varicellaria rhodocarpa]
MALRAEGERAFSQRHGPVAMIQVLNKHFATHFVDMIKEFNRASNEYLERLSAKLMALEDADTKIDFEDSGDGALTIKHSDRGTYVINKQKASRQIWVSSPVSGPFRFDYIEMRDKTHKWVSRKETFVSLDDLLKEELGVDMSIVDEE